MPSRTMRCHVASEETRMYAVSSHLGSISNKSPQHNVPPCLGRHLGAELLSSFVFSSRTQLCRNVVVVLHRSNAHFRWPRSCRVISCNGPSVTMCDETQTQQRSCGLELALGTSRPTAMNSSASTSLAPTSLRTIEVSRECIANLI